MCRSKSQCSQELHGCVEKFKRSLKPITSAQPISQPFPTWNELPGPPSLANDDSDANIGAGIRECTEIKKITWARNTSRQDGLGKKTCPPQ
jgi:hypothetical protein